MELARAPLVVCTGIASTDAVVRLPALPACEGEYSASIHLSRRAAIPTRAEVGAALGGIDAREQADVDPGRSPLRRSARPAEMST